MRRHAQTDRTVNAGDFFDNGRVFDVTHSRAAVFFGENHAHQTEFGELRAQFNREMLRFVPFHHVRFDLGFRKFADAHFYLLLFFV